MKLIIDIPNFEWLKNEEDFKTAVKEYDQGTKFDKEIRNALLNGKPLPEHHGRIIDESKITKCYMPINQLDVRGIRTDAQTIIEADKESERNDT